MLSSILGEIVGILCRMGRIFLRKEGQICPKLWLKLCMFCATLARAGRPISRPAKPRHPRYHEVCQRVGHNATEALMYSQNPAGKHRGHTELGPLDPAAEGPLGDLEEWDGVEPSPLWDVLWDAFELDDEMAEPQPEYGDFWEQPEAEEQL
jgi:hypothetical protein